MAFNSVRNYLAERLARVKEEWKLFQSHHSDQTETAQAHEDSDLRRYYKAISSDPTNEVKNRMLQSEFDNLKAAMRIDNESRSQPFELHSQPHPDAPYPDSRLPAPGIVRVPLFYHSGHVIHADPLTSRPLNPDLDADQLESYIPGDIDFGPEIDPILYALITQKYPTYLPYINKYCRPAGTTDATFRDFNKEQKPSAPIPEDRQEAVLSHVFRLLDATPYLPIHFVDTQYAKTPLVTGTGYHNRFSYKARAHAKYSHPAEYADRPTSKGFFYNATYENARTIIHKIKESGVPFNLHFAPEDADLSDAQVQQYIDSCNDFFNDYPTLLFTRNHISDREKTLKVRPVYAVDDLFIIIELMLTFPLLVQARKPSCCIMYGYETIRGANHLLDRLARSYETYFTIDWSGFDQRLPRVITDIYYTKFLRRLIVISHGYQPTYEYPDYPDLDAHKLYTRMDNLLHFLHLWYNNMTFLSVDGYAFRRTSAGVPSGLYNTQYLDSFSNLFLLIDGMIEFGFTDEEIRSVLLLVLGDDNTGMTSFDLKRLKEFISFLESYALARYNMHLSKTKSVITSLRSKIETLGYSCNYGRPKRPLDKLVAQLCYPEHKIKYHTMSARAIGIAYAAAAQDITFHTFCRDVYTMFSVFYKPDVRSNLDFLRSVLSDLEVPLAHFDSSTLPPFPSFEQVRARYASYQGPLQYTPKWNIAHFKNMPDVIPETGEPVMTMHIYEKLHGITPRMAPTFSTVVPST
uniref:RNA-dependent RNA-polymerase n=1 Tax=Rosellinia necatrix partitivirus 4 TaxID=1148493 RepID=J7M5F9_9VIRU|nr:RNA-dependent RNA-polymerase [Rosellinia necatrix partitivirus 4]